MYKSLFAITVLTFASLSPLQAAAPNDYQVTGPVLELTDSTITVQKGKEKWELARSAETGVKGGDLKVGDKVTVHYTMTAKSIEVKPAKATK